MFNVSKPYWAKFIVYNFLKFLINLLKDIPNVTLVNFLRPITHKIISQKTLSYQTNVPQSLHYVRVEITLRLLFYEYVMRLSFLKTY